MVRIPHLLGGEPLTADPVVLRTVPASARPKCSVADVHHTAYRVGSFEAVYVILGAELKAILDEYGLIQVPDEHDCIDRPGSAMQAGRKARYVIASHKLVSLTGQHTCSILEVY